MTPILMLRFNRPLWGGVLPRFLVIRTYQQSSDGPIVDYGCCIHRMNIGRYFAVTQRALDLKCCATQACGAREACSLL